MLLSTILLAASRRGCDAPPLMLVASTVTTIALLLGLYATALSTLVALVTLYGEVFARIDVIAREAHLVDLPEGRRLVLVGDAFDPEEMPPGARALEIVTIAVRNRGRRAAQITMMSKPSDAGFHILDELLPSFPLTIEPGHTRTLTIGGEGGYEAGDLGEVTRFFVADGAGRIHPLRERLRQAPARAWRRLRARMRR